MLAGMSPQIPSRDEQNDAALTVGTRVRITQQIAARHYAFDAPVEGTIVDIDSRPTGSWYTHGVADKLWLDRVVLRKNDGEISTLNLDEHSRIERLG